MLDSITFSSEMSFDESRIPVWRRWLDSVVSAENKRLGDLSFRFMSDEEVYRVNGEFLDHWYYTDVITFDRTRGSKVSGDVVISLDRVVENAQTEGQTFEDELDRVIVHSVLHLCGHGDKSDFEALKMRELEDKYLSLRP